MNLSEELMQCVNREQKQYDRLVEEYQRLVRRLEECDAAIADRQKVFQQIQDDVLRANQLSSMEEALESQLWQHLSQMSSEIEHRCHQILMCSKQQRNNRGDSI